MEEAKITNDAAQSTGYPSLVTEDDLQLELGRWMVASLNKDKIIQKIVAQQAQLAQRANEADESASMVPGLKKSNDLLAGKNTALAEAAETARREARESIEFAKREAKEAVEASRMAKEATEFDAKTISEELDRVQEALTDKNKEISVLKGKCTRLEKKLEGR